MDVACSDFHPVRSVTGVSKRHRYGGADALASLARAIDRSAPQLIVAADDIAVDHLQSLRKAGSQALAARIEDSLGPAESYEVIASRVRLIAVAQALGLDAPDCTPIASAGDLEGWLRQTGTPAFLKLDASCGGEGVRLVRGPDDAAAAFAAFGRTVGKGPLSRLRKQGPVFSAQRSVIGRPANCSAFAWRGEVLGVVSVVTLETLHAFGIATVVRPVESAAMRNAAVALARELRLTGFFGLDFIVQGEGERAWLLELNPRPTPISHFALGPGQDLVAALVSKLDGRPPVARPVAPRLGAEVAIFPYMLRDNGAGAQADWPVGQPQLIRAFARRRRLGACRDMLRSLLGGAKPPVPDRARHVCPDGPALAVKTSADAVASKD